MDSGNVSAVARTLCCDTAGSVKVTIQMSGPSCQYISFNIYNGPSSPGWSHSS